MCECVCAWVLLIASKNPCMQLRKEGRALKGETSRGRLKRELFSELLLTIK